MRRRGTTSGDHDRPLEVQTYLARPRCSLSVGRDGRQLRHASCVEVHPTNLRKLGCPVEVVGCPVLGVGPELADSAEDSPGSPVGELGDPLPDVFVSVISSIKVVMMLDGASCGQWLMLFPAATV